RAGSVQVGAVRSGGLIDLDLEASVDGAPCRVGRRPRLTGRWQREPWVTEPDEDPRVVRLGVDAELQAKGEVPEGLQRVPEQPDVVARVSDHDTLCWVEGHGP